MSKNKKPPSNAHLCSVNSSALRRHCALRLAEKYSLQEANRLAFRAISYIYGISEAKIITGIELDAAKIEPVMERLMAFEPMEYIMGEAEFLGRKLLVTRDVMIPRPETEELVLLAKSLAGHPRRLVDICTGSGCIAGALADFFPQAVVEGWDISPAALRIARKNLPDSVILRQLDFLKPDQWPQLQFDGIVCNPPYVPESEKSQLKPNVLDYEPHLALFVPDTDVLVFYRYLAIFGKQFLSEDGFLVAEINENQVSGVLEIFEKQGFLAQVHHDISAKPRIVSAKK